MRRLRVSGQLLVLAAALGLPACGAPSPTGANVAGNWSGTFTFAGSTVPTPYTMALSQTGTTVTGSFSLTLGADVLLGNVSGTTTTSAFSGNLTILQVNCVAAVSGNAGASPMTWTSAAGFNSVCGGGAFTALVNKQ